ncbi:MAG: flagellar brake protein [Burkholderiales bacterium]|nr:flagellar brake protein [Burkholderiales bacterium]
MNPLGALTPINAEQVKLGEALAFDIFDAWGNLLHDKGSVVTDADEFASILDDGYFEDSMGDAPSIKEIPLPAATQTSGYSQPAPTTPDASNLAPIITPAKPAENNQDTELNKESAVLDLDSVRWHVGEPFYLQVQENPNVRYTVRLIGYVKNQSILVTAPRIDGRGAIIRDGQNFIVRSFPGKKAYAFTASALKSVYTPHAYLHLSYPKIIRCSAIRQSSRASVKIIASISVGTPEQIGAVSLSDISMGGTSGILKRAIGKKGDEGIIKFKVNTAGEDAYLSIPIIVRSIVETENTDEFRYGFEFVNIPTQSKIILSSFVHQTLAESE